jgi:hypothetical protein
MSKGLFIFRFASPTQPKREKKKVTPEDKETRKRRRCRKRIEAKNNRKADHGSTK